MSPLPEISFVLAGSTPLASQRASFMTHLNYIKCMERFVASSSISGSIVGTPTLRIADIKRFRKLDIVTRKSIRKDIALAREDAAFAVIAAPWFPVKCYYSLYYLESILIHLIDGTISGFGKGGHSAVRKKIYSLVATGKLSFGVPELSCVHVLANIQNFPSIAPGQNATNDFWCKAECLNSVAKKLMEYKLHDVRMGKRWNLHTKKHRIEQSAFISAEKLMLIDFFYWYRIKANYRDLDYIDFENGITEIEVRTYIEAYYNTYTMYRSQLLRKIGMLMPSV
ncbi:MAG: hypothetical protein WC397_02995 [Candidatus Paceibacterota bacterium]|jgi:hypothetical protein